jgi:catechol 2,3-dioxygenase-like lactoylglutathione lyase family enzyme
VSRIQLALRVGDLDAAVGFYGELFGVGPAKRRPGYANFAVADPPLKLVLIEGTPGADTGLDHLGIEVGTAGDVTDAAARLSAAGLPTDLREGTTCCYAVQDKVWVHGPGGEPWEVYTVTADDRPELEGHSVPARAGLGGDGGGRPRHAPDRGPAGCC